MPPAVNVRIVEQTERPKPRRRRALRSTDEEVADADAGSAAGRDEDGELASSPRLLMRSLRSCYLTVALQQVWFSKVLTLQTLMTAVMVVSVVVSPSCPCVPTVT